MGKSSSAKMQVAEYRMSIHFGICAGPVDAIEAIYVGEKVAWQGSVSDLAEIPIDKPELFGGVKKEGGLKGVLHFLPGAALQVIPAVLAQRFGKTPDTCPGFRGLTSIMFIGAGTREGFLWGANNPYLRPIWAKVRRTSKGLDEALAKIGPDTNGAHMVFECLTNRDWGMGAPTGLIDVASFHGGAETLFDESFGLSMMWTRQSPIENFIAEVLDHIQATLFVNPRTGLLTFKLLRDDYDLDSLRVISPDNATLSNFQRKAWGETVNEIVVTYTNPENEEDLTTTAQDLANIGIQGEIISSGRNYYGVRNGALAQRLAERDLRASSAPIASCDATLDRSGWDLLPGEVNKLTWPEYGIENLVVRAGSVNYGKPGAGSIKASLYEDIFSFTTAAYFTPPDTEATDPSEFPAPMEFVHLLTAPAYLTARALGEEADALDYPEVVAAVLAAQDSDDTLSYELMTEAVLPNGDTVFENAGTKQLVGRALLAEALTAEASSEVAAFDDVLGDEPPAASFVFIGDGAEDETEIALIQSVDEDGWTLLRGVLDTTPRAWPEGTPVWFVEVGDNIVDTTLRSEGETVEYKLLPRTSKGLLAEAEAEIESVVLTGRPHLPNRPANVTVGGVAFGELDAGGLDEIAVTWANRNRLLETTQVLGWDDADVTPEAGQTTVVTVLSAGGDVLAVHDGLTGTSFDLPAASFGNASGGRVRVTAERDGLESLQGHEIEVTGLTGYGRAYGFGYGG